MPVMIGLWLRRDRERLGLRLARAAWLVGVTPAALRRIEDGEESPSSDRWEKLAALYGWPRSYWPPR